MIYSPYIPGHNVAEAREEWRIVVDVCARARPDRARKIDYADTAAIRADIEDTIPAYRGIASLSKQGDQFQWGGERLCDGGVFGTPSGRARLVANDPPDTRLRAGEFHVATRRGKQFNSIVQAEVDPITGAARDHVFMHPRDMHQHGFEPNQRVRLENGHGAYVGRVFPAPVTPRTLQLHWPEANVLLSPSKRDRGGRVPDYNAVVAVHPA